MSGTRRVLIVGGVAGGASCAARLRRLDESAEIVIFERGPHVSFANCGLPYFVGDVIPKESQLLVASPELFDRRFDVRVFTRHDVVAIDRERRVVRVRDLDASGDRAERDEPYDGLVLAPGASPVRPPVPGMDLPGIFVVRTIPDSVEIRRFLSERAPKRAVVVGGGFIGLEMAENLARRGLHVTILEKLPQLLPPLDPEMAVLLAQRLQREGIVVRLGDGLAGFEPEGDALAVRTESGDRLGADLVIVGIGVRPETSLARSAGLAIGERGGIVVDAQMRTSDPAIYAVGDAVEVRDVVLGQDVLVPLAGPANREGRVAAEALCGRESRFRGVQATAVVGACGLTAACTGANEKTLRRSGRTAYRAVHLHPGHHATYYPGARPIHLKLLFSVPEGRILGAQAVGEEGVEKRIDVIATAMQLGGTVRDLAEAELCYAPQFGAAKDPVNLAGMIATNHLDGLMPLADWSALGGALVVDVREPDEFAAGHVSGATNLPLSQLRKRHRELPPGRPIAVYCRSGQRSYYATRFLLQHGRDVANLSGGWLTFDALRSAGASGRAPVGSAPGA